MDKKDVDIEVLRSRFFKIYPTIPLPLRNEIVALVGEKNEPASWGTAYMEISQNTPKGNEILKRLHQLGVLDE
jgi:hypothetical protein